MIDRASILAWSEHAPWSEPFMIEQDLIICKALVCIFGDEFLARLVCFHPSTDKNVNYRIHTTPEDVVTKVEIETKVKGKKEWSGLNLLEKRQ